jgi:3-methyladenine DNA glycosylase AlkD
MAPQLIKDLQNLANPEKAKILQRFFKTGKGEYGEGDLFLGITVPEQRKLAKKYQALTLKEVQKLLSSSYHEHRLTSLLILVIKYSKSDEEGKKEIVDFYLKNTKHINNWDLVDSSADKIIGDYLLERARSILYKLAESENIWERRIAIMATFRFIKNNQFKDTMKISEMLIRDDHDLIHKAVGWMLRETGKRDMATEEAFLKKHYKKMPRTMLRYAIEKFNQDKRRTYLKNLV